MSAIAEFYSKNLSQEAKKGLHEKARRGGTPAYAPLGYLNTTTRIDGQELKTVVIDEDRADHIRWAFDAYASGDWSISVLADELERRGLKSRTTRKYVGSPLSNSMVHRMLSNAYYTGCIIYGGIEYAGKHEPLIDDQTFADVQALLAARRISGDRSWIRQQYLKGSVFCDRCGERMGYGHSTGRGGEYAYFFCLGRHRKRNDCDLPYLLADKVESAVIDVWDDVRFTTELITQVATTTTNELTELASQDEQTITTQKRRVQALERQKQKLIDAFLAEAIPVDDLKARQATIQVELLAAKRLITQASAKYDMLKQRLSIAMELLARADELYRQSADDGRRTMNQALFDGHYLDVDDQGHVFIAHSELKPEFDVLVQIARSVETKPHQNVSDLIRRAEPCARMKQTTRASRPASCSDMKNPGQLSAVRGSNLAYLAEREGFEPSTGSPLYPLSKRAH
ncbi:MAG: hypothetical protein NVSMB46_06620 [Candidatus Saccharimonadales bacterium]